MSKNKKEKSYSSDALEKAVKLVQDKEMTAYAAAKSFTIPITSLRDKLHGKHPGSTGRNTVLTPEEEVELVDWLIECAEMGDPKMKWEILNAAAEIVKLRNDPKRSFKNDLPTVQWLNGLLQRHPRVSIRTPETISRASAVVSKSNIERFVEGLQNWLKQHFSEDDLNELLNDPSRWANTDETGFELNARAKKVYARKGAKTVYRVDSSKPKEKVTVTYTFLADGTMINPMVTFKDSCCKIQDIAYALGSKYSSIHFAGA